MNGKAKKQTIEIHKLQKSVYSLERTVKWLSNEVASSVSYRNELLEVKSRNKRLEKDVENLFNLNAGLAKRFCSVSDMLVKLHFTIKERDSVVVLLEHQRNHVIRNFELFSQRLVNLHVICKDLLIQKDLHTQLVTHTKGLENFLPKQSCKIKTLYDCHRQEKFEYQTIINKMHQKIHYLDEKARANESNFNNTTKGSEIQQECICLIEQLQIELEACCYRIETLLYRLDETEIKNMRMEKVLMIREQEKDRIRAKSMNSTPLVADKPKIISRLSDCGEPKFNTDLDKLRFRGIVTTILVMMTQLMNRVKVNCVNTNVTIIF